MSLYDYRESIEISAKDPQFAALIMSAMRKADSTNIALLRWAWPQIWMEFQARYHSPGGILPGEMVRAPEPEPADVCTACKGEGKISAWLHEGVEIIGCPDCKGTGVKSGSGPCSVCQTETTYTRGSGGNCPVWLCPDHGGRP